MSNSDLSFLAELESIIRDRIERPVPDSYVTRLLRDGTRRQAQKVGEEAVELALAAVSGDTPEQLEEAADLLFHMLVLLSSKRLVLADVVKVLERRHRRRE
jgi:phosphoribosyl-ATP pyrophosphohydrolase/phosphoribosyl-AMP cyclohydrolase